MKTKTMRKLLALALTAVMSASLLTGCGNTAKESSEVQSSEVQSSEVKTNQAESSAAQSSEAVEDAFEHDSVLNDLGVEPICKEKVTITIGLLQHANVEDYDTNHYTKIIALNILCETDKLKILGENAKKILKCYKN